MKNRKDIIAITSGIVEEICPEELEVFLSVSESLFDEVENKANVSNLGSTGFGDASDALSTILMIIVTTAAIEISKEGVKFTKYGLKIWIKNNYDKLSVKIKNKRWKSAVNMIKDYLDE